jgi:hypothetical protein
MAWCVVNTLEHHECISTCWNDAATLQVQTWQNSTTSTTRRSRWVWNMAAGAAGRGRGRGRARVEVGTIMRRRNASKKPVNMSSDNAQSIACSAISKCLNLMQRSSFDLLWLKHKHTDRPILSGQRCFYECKSFSALK